MALAEDGGLLVAAARGLATVSPDGEVSFGPDLLGARTDRRLNDGTVDPQGRFVVGSLSLGPETGDDVLLRVSADGVVETLRDGLRLSNGIAFSPDGRHDLPCRHLRWDGVASLLRTGRVRPRRALDGRPRRRCRTIPDGLTVSADGDLWVAQFGGSSVRRHAPTGELIDIVTIDAAQATCPAFVGPDLGILAITSGHEALETWSDNSGAIFLADVGATGLPETRWPGSTTTPYWKAG